MAMPRMPSVPKSLSIYGLLSLLILSRFSDGIAHQGDLPMKRHIVTANDVHPGGDGEAMHHRSPELPIFDRTIREQKVQLYRGDRVVLYTDGVVEAMNEEREEWGDETFYKFVCQNAELPSKDFVRLLLQALEEHKGAAEQHDDITVTTFRIVG